MTTISDLSIAELSAARLDGELFDLNNDYVSVAEPECAEARARTLTKQIPEQAIVERHSALWIYGALARPPTPLQLCLGIHSTVRITAVRQFVVREVALQRGDVVRVGGVQVTSPVRTAIDLARTEERFDQNLVRQLADLIEAGKLTFADFERRFHLSPGLPHKNLALARLRLVFESARDQPPLTRYTS